MPQIGNLESIRPRYTWQRRYERLTVAITTHKASLPTQQCTASIFRIKLSKLLFLRQFESQAQPKCQELFTT